MFLDAPAFDVQLTATIDQMAVAKTLLVDAIFGDQTVDASAWDCSRNGESKQLVSPPASRQQLQTFLFLFFFQSRLLVHERISLELFIV